MSTYQDILLTIDFMNNTLIKYFDCRSSLILMTSYIIKNMYILILKNLKLKILPYNWQPIFLLLITSDLVHSYWILIKLLIVIEQLDHKFQTRVVKAVPSILRLN